MSFQFPTDTEKRYTKKLKKKRDLAALYYDQSVFFFAQYLPSVCNL